MYIHTNKQNDFTYEIIIIVKLTNITVHRILATFVFLRYIHVAILNKNICFLRFIQKDVYSFKTHIWALYNIYIYLEIQINSK